MKKAWILLMVTGLLLTGCGAEETFETVADEPAAPVIAEQRQVYVELPGEVASPTVESDSGRLYYCGDYEISIQILNGGNREATLRTLTGFGPGALTVLETRREGLPCLEFAWSCTGEDGELVCRAMVIDDGSYHYCLTVLAPTETARQNRAAWDDMFSSFRLV